MHSLAADYNMESGGAPISPMLVIGSKNALSLRCSVMHLLTVQDDLTPEIQAAVTEQIEALGAPSSMGF